MAVAYMMFIRELRRNGGGTAATAENRQQPPNFFSSISRWIKHFWIIWAQLIFFKQFTLTFALNTCEFFGWIVKYLKYYKCQIQKCKGNFFEKKKIASNDSKLSNSARNGKKKFGGRWRFCGGSGDFAAVSSQFLNKHHKSNCYTKAHCFNSFFGWVPALVLMVSKSGTSAPPL